MYNNVVMCFKLTCDHAAFLFSRLPNKGTRDFEITDQKKICI